MNRELSKIFLTLACYLLFIYPIPADSNLGGADYLESGAGARWAGMGGAARAAARDTTAGYWNPAGLAAQGPAEWQFGSMLSMAPMGRRLSWMSASLQTDRMGSWSAGWMHNTVDGLETVDGAGSVGVDGNSAEDAIFLSHGGSLLYQLKWGVTGKVLSQNMLGYSGMGGALDAGILLQPFLDHEVFMAFTAENIVGAFSWNTGTRDRLPRAYAGGLSARIFRDLVLLSGDAVFHEGIKRIEYHGGMEYWLFEQMALRGGMDGAKPAAGATYLFRPYQADYAFVYDGSGLGSRHLVSFSLIF